MIGTVVGMPELKARLRADLNTAMKARDELTTATLRMALTAVTTEEVAGKQARELSDDEVLRVVTREAKKRREAAEAFDAAGRTELAERERAEGRCSTRTCPPSWPTTSWSSWSAPPSTRPAPAVRSRWARS